MNCDVRSRNAKLHNNESKVVLLELHEARQNNAQSSSCYGRAGENQQVFENWEMSAGKTYREGKKVVIPKRRHPEQRYPRGEHQEHHLINTEPWLHKHYTIRRCVRVECIIILYFWDTVVQCARLPNKMKVKVNE